MIIDNLQILALDTFLKSLQWVILLLLLILMKTEEEYVIYIYFSFPLWFPEYCSAKLFNHFSYDNAFGFVLSSPFPSSFLLLSLLGVSLCLLSSSFPSVSAACLVWGVFSAAGSQSLSALDFHFLFPLATLVESHLHAFPLVSPKLFLLQESWIALHISFLWIPAFFASLSFVLSPSSSWLCFLTTPVSSGPWFPYTNIFENSFFWLFLYSCFTPGPPLPPALSVLFSGFQAWLEKIMKPRWLSQLKCLAL